MGTYPDSLRSVPLFEGMEQAEMEALLRCLAPIRRKYQAGSAVLLEGASAGHIGVVLEGAVQIVDEDVFGRRNIIGTAGPGELFGEAFACAQIANMPVSVWAAEDSDLLFLEYGRVIHTCSDACAFHSRLVTNMVSTLAGKNLTLNRKIRCLSRRSTRSKLLMYLTEQAKRADGPFFRIPFDRQALADYLCVERSAMSAELSKLKQEGILDFHRSTFRFLREPD